MSEYSALIGLLLMALGIPGLVAPSFWRGLLGKFPRWKTGAWALAAIGLAWAAYRLLMASFMADWPLVRRLVLVGTPVAYLLIVFFLGELLAPRALGGLLLLAPLTVLETAALHPSPLRLVVTVLCYVCVVAGIWLVLCPYRFRTTVESLMPDNTAARITGAVLTTAGAVFLCLGFTVYRQTGVV